MEEYARLEAPGEAGRLTRGDEARLVRRCAQGDPTARDELRDRYGALIYGLARSAGRKRGETEDLAQDVYVTAVLEGRIFSAIAGFQGETTLRRYLAAFTIPALLRSARVRARHVDTCEFDETTIVGGRSAPEAASSEQQSRRRLHRLLASLPGEKALVIKLWQPTVFELSDEDVRLVARLGRHSEDTVRRLLGELLHNVVRREQALQAEEDTLAPVQERIRHHERALRLLSDQRSSARSVAVQRHLARKIEVHAAKRRSRLSQRKRILRRLRSRRVSAPYKDMAALLGTTTSILATKLQRALAAIRNEQERQDAA